MKKRFDVPFPPKLKDLVSVNHRIAAFLESYFDIIFAVNELTHPGEKRMISYAAAHANLLPNQFEQSLNTLLMSITASPEILEKQLREIIANLEEILS